MFGTFDQQDPFVRQRNTFGQSNTSQTWPGDCAPGVGSTTSTFGLFKSSENSFGQQIRQQPHTFDQSQPHTFGQPLTVGHSQPAAHTFGQPLTVGHSQPLTFGQPLTVGQSQLTTQPLTFGQPRPAAQPLLFGQSQPLTFGQSRPAAQPLTFGQPQPLTFGQPQPLTFGQPQPTAQPLTFGQPATQYPSTIHVKLAPISTLVVYDIGSQHNKISGEEYLLLNDLNLSIDYCEKIQRELQVKMNSIVN